MVIKNFNELATTPLRKDCLQIAEAGLEAIRTQNLVRQQFNLDKVSNILKVQEKTFDLKKFKRIICIGFGKVALEAVTAIQESLGDRISCGFVIDLKQGSLNNIVCKIGTHPQPTMINVEATQELLEMLGNTAEDDLVICVVGGGGSSLLCSPHDSTCINQSLLIDVLMKKGASIQEINTVRKHISEVKGGHLAKICYPATVIGLIFSDIPGNDISQVASGPTTYDSSTIEDTKLILKKYTVLADTGFQSYPLQETPKESKYFDNVHNFLFSSGSIALQACKKEAEKLNYKVSIFSEQFQGEARILGPEIVNTSKGPKTCLLGCGESTVIVKGKGTGGRNQELVLSALQYLKDNQVITSIASDGHDNSDTAGAIGDKNTLKKASELNLNPKEFQKENDSFSFFSKTGGLIQTGLTGSNVSDFFILLEQ